MAQGLSRVSRPTAAELLNTPEGLEWRHVHYSLARLESTKRSSIILAAFCFAVFASLQVSIPTSCPTWISLLLALNTAVLILMHSFAFLVSVFLLPRLQAVVHEYRPPRDGDTTMKPVPSSPHHGFRGIVEVSYNISHVLGLFLYLLEIVLLSWVKFWDFSYAACLASTVCMAPFLALFVAACWYFNRVLSQHAYQTRSHLLESVARDYDTLSDESESKNVSMSPRGSRTHVNRYDCRSDEMEPANESKNVSMSPGGSRTHANRHDCRSDESSLEPANETKNVSMSPGGSRTSSVTRVNRAGHTNRAFVADIHAPDTE